MLQRKISQLLSFSLMPLKQCKSPSTYSKGFLEGEETDIFPDFTEHGVSYMGHIQTISTEPK